MTAPRRRAAVALALLLAGVVLLGAGEAADAAAGPAPLEQEGSPAVPAHGPYGAGPLAAQPAGDGFGSDGQVADRYQIPVWQYDVDGLRARGPDVGQVANTAPLGAAAFVFQFVKFLVAAIVWLLRFALDFGVAGVLLGPVEELIGVYQGFVGDLGLVPLALMLCVFWFGLAALRGRVGRGAGEITLSFALAVVLGGVLAAPGPLLLSDEGLLGRAKDLGATVAVLAVQDPTVAQRVPGCRQVVAHEEPLIDGCLPDELGRDVPRSDDPRVLRWILQTWLVDMYVRHPHQYVVYGQRLDCPISLNVRGGSTAGGDEEPCQPHPCVGRYNEILRTTSAEAAAMIDRGEANSSADPNSYMYDMMHPTAGGYDLDDDCPDDDAAELAAYNNSGDWGRVAVALVLLFSLLVLALFVVAGVLLPLIAGQVLVAVLAVALVFVLPVALLGGGSRRVLWRWFGLLLAATFMIVVALVGLSLMLVTTDLLLRTEWHLYASLLMVCISSMVFLWLQRRLLRGGFAGGASAGTAVGRIHHRGAATAGDGDPGGGAWARTATAGLDQSTRFASAGGLREQMAAYRRYGREQRARDRWERAHPGRLAARVDRQQRAEEEWIAANPDVSHARSARLEEATDRWAEQHPERLVRRVARQEWAKDQWQRRRPRGGGGGAR